MKVINGNVYYDLCDTVISVKQLLHLKTILEDIIVKEHILGKGHDQQVQFALGTTNYRLARERAMAKWLYRLYNCDPGDTEHALVKKFIQEIRYMDDRKE